MKQHSMPHGPDAPSSSVAGPSPGTRLLLQALLLLLLTLPCLGAAAEVRGTLAQPVLPAAAAGAETSPSATVSPENGQDAPAVGADGLSASDRLLLFDELAKTHLALDQPGEAVADLNASLALAPKAETFSQLAKAYQALGENALAAAQYQQALALREDPQDLADLGYCLLSLGRREEAVAAWDKALALQPERLRLWEDAGYAYMALSRNALAIARFKSAIDNQPLYPVESQEQAKETRQTLYRLRQEVSKLDTNLTVTGYLSYYTSRAGQLDAPGGQAGLYQPSISGVEVNWAPPIIGQRDDRVFQLVGRVNWTLKRQSLEFDPDTTQAAFGVRYKPFKSQNMFFGVERLVKIGALAENNWLLRAQGSWADGYDYKPESDNWNFSYLYLEAARFVETPARFMFNGEARQGWTFKAANNLLVTPHVVVNGRLWTPDASQLSIWEAGLGLSVKYLFNQTQYTTPRSYAEIVAQYKGGLLFNRRSNQSVDGLYITTILHF